VDFFAVLGCDTHSKSELRQDNLHMKWNWCCRASHEH